MESYTPKIITDNHTVYVQVLIEGKKCHICKKVMIKEANALMCGGSFPNYFKLGIKEQAKNAGLEFISVAKVDNHEICVTCKESGKADFLCQLCNLRKPSDKIKENIGEPAVYLCKDCYEAVPAKQWDEIVDRLNSEREYDYE